MLYQFTQEKLHAIEQQLRALNIWSLAHPSDAAMASTAPFACDLMPLEQWLQFIFLPKMQAIIQQRQALPSNIAIAPMAQYVWKNKHDYQPLIFLLNDLDTLLNDAS